MKKNNNKNFRVHTVLLYLCKINSVKYIIYNSLSNSCFMLLIKRMRKSIVIFINYHFIVHADGLLLL